MPAQFRKVLQASEADPDNVVIFLSFDETHLVGTTMDWLESIQDKIDQSDEMDDDYRDYLSSLFGDSAILDYSDNGRIIVPKHMLESAGIEEDVAFMGVGRTFQIWDPEKLAAYKKTARQRVSARGGRIKNGGGGAA